MDSAAARLPPALSPIRVISVSYTHLDVYKRQVKNEEEIKIMRQASVINDMVMERAAAYIKEGMTEKQIADFIEAEYYKEGATGLSFDTIVCFGANAADQHHSPSETRTLKAGECVLIDMGCIWNGYCSDMTRTFYCKSVDEEQAAIHDLVRTAVEKAEAIIKPGVRFCDIDAQARDCLLYTSMVIIPTCPSTSYVINSIINISF